MKNKQLNEIYPWKNEAKSDFINRFMRVMSKEYPNVKQRYAVAYSYWDRRNDRKLEESDHTQQAIDAFGTTYYRTRAGFMLKDGRLLDLTYGGGPREDHRNIQDAFDDMDLDSESDYLIEFMNEGNIRLIPEIPGIDIAVEPTDRQYAALKYYIDFFIGRKKYFGVQFSNKNGDQVDWKEYNGLTSSAEIILDIKDYFEDKLTESWYDDSVPMVEYLGNNQAAIWQAIRDRFVVDNHPVSGPSFLLPNGDFIDLSSSYNSEASFEDFPAHAEVEDFLQFSGLSDVSGDIIDGSPSIQGLGAIRLNDLEDNNYIELPESNLTLAQYDSLEGWLDENSRKRDTVVVSDLGFNNYVEYNYSDYLPEDIIKKIKRYYSSSHLYESIVEFNSFPPNDLLDYIKSNFNPSDYYSEGQSYILPDGEFLNLWDGAHIGVDDTLYERGLIKEDPYFSGKLVLMDDYNSIRMSDGKYIQTDPYIELPKKLPSNAQLNSLLDFLDSLTDKSVWVGVRGNKNAGASYNLENVLPEQVIKNIKRFYSSGVLYEAIESNSVFNLKKIGMSHYDEWLNSQPARDRDNVKIEIKELSPKEYLEACAEIFGNSFESQKKQIQYDKEIIKELQDLIKKSVSLNVTFLDYVSNPPTQEGRHRMYALAELYGWDKKYPVIIFTPADPERAKRDQLEKQQEKLYKYIDKAVTNALDYTYRNYDELKDQINYYLENYIDNPKVKISERGHWLVITVNGLEYEISQDEFDWDENRQDPKDDFDIEDLS